MSEIGNLHSIPKNWVWTEVSQIGEINTGCTPSKKDDNNYGNYMPFVKPPQLCDCVIAKADDNLSEKGVKLARVLPPKSILVSCIGNLGKTGINKIPVSFNQQINAVTLPKHVVPEFLFYYFQTSEINSWLYSIASATTIPIVNKSKFSKAPVPLSPFSEQNRIVCKLEELFTKLDAGVESLQNVKAQLQLYRQAVLKHAFNGKLTEEWRKTHKKTIQPATKILEQIELKQKPNKKTKDSTTLTMDISGFPELPEMWVSIRVKDVTESMKNGIYKPKQYYNENGIACLRMYNIQNGAIDWVDIKRMNLTKVEIEDYALRSGDILVNRVNSRELVGKSAVIPSELELSVFESKNIRLRIIRNLMNSKFLNFWFLYFSQNYFNRNAQQTVGMASINQAQLGSMPVPFPSLTEQNEIVEKIEDVFSFCQITNDNVEKSIAQSEALRQSILKTAFEGKLVSQDPNDEPAEMLLEQIKQHKAKQGKMRQRSLSGYVK